MAFTYDITTDRGKVRFVLGDITSAAGILPGGSNFSDAEIDTILTLAGTWQKAVPTLARAAAAQWGIKAASISIGDYSESRQQVANLNALADKYDTGTLPGAWSDMGLGTSTLANIAVVD